MSITDRIPRLKGTGSRRAVDRIAELEAIITRLRAENRTLLTRQMAADDFFAILTHDRTKVYKAWEYEAQCRAEAELVAVCVQSERDDLADEVVQLRRQLAPYLAAEANAGAVSPPPLIRDTSHPADQATEPIPVVRPLWDKPGIGPVLDPGQTSWGAARETAEGVAS